MQALAAEGRIFYAGQHDSEDRTTAISKKIVNNVGDPAYIR